jgi:hypothetical protein
MVIGDTAAEDGLLPKRSVSPFGNRPYQSIQRGHANNCGLLKCGAGRWNDLTGQFIIRDIA